MIENPLCSPGHPRILTNDASMLWPSLLGNVLQGLTYLAHVVAKLTFLWEQLFCFSTHNFKSNYELRNRIVSLRLISLQVSRTSGPSYPTHLISFVLSSVLNLIYFPWSSFETKVWGEWSWKFWFIQLLHGYTHITTDVEFVTSSACVSFFWARVKVSRLKCEKLPFLMMNIDLKLWLFEG